MLKNLIFMNRARGAGTAPVASQEQLDRAIAELRTSIEPAQGRLSEGLRDKILEVSLRPGEEIRPMSSLFLPTQKLALAGGLPLALSAALLFVFAYLRTPPVAPLVGVQATKQGDQVILTIADGGRSHIVYKSNIPVHFERGRGIRIENGSFSDLATGGPDVVFYRIE